MALVLADRVKETTTTTGTGTVTLLGASTGFQSFAAVGNANTTYYTITAQTGTEWEVGIGTYTSAGTLLARNTVLSSSNGGSAVNFSAGTKDVFVTYPSSRSVYADGTTLTATNSSILPATSGGTGQSSYAIGDILFASTTTALSKLADVATGNAIISGGVGVAPSYGKIGLTTHVSGTLPIANGGTNSTATATAGGISYGTGTAYAVTAAGTAGQVVTSGGTGAPTFTTATNANTASAIVQRDASGNFSAGTITAALSGNATTASSLSNALTLGTYLTGTSYNGSSAVTAAVDATSANTASKVVARDASGNFSAGTITAALTGNVTGNVTGSSGSTTGNAATATVLQTARTINGTSFNGSADITITANTTNTLTLGTYLTGTSFNGSAAVTAAVDATTTNTASKVVARDASGNFSAGTITASLTGNASGSAATFTSTSQNSQFNSIGVGTAASTTAGEIRATNSVTAHYSDDRLKTKLGNIEGALAKVKTLSGFYYEANETAQALGYKPKREVGVSAQSVQAVLPEVVVPAPIDEQYLTVHYEKLVPLLIEAIKELEAKVAALEAKG
jgi:hypothetical protein